MSNDKLLWGHKLLLQRASEVEQAMVALSAMLAGREVTVEDIDTYVEEARRLKHWLNTEKPRTITLEEWECQQRRS